MPVQVEHSEGAYLMDDMIREAFNELKKQYRVEWIDQAEECFYLYFSKGSEYRIFTSGDYAELEVKKCFLGRKCWHPVSHAHYDDPDDTQENILRAVEGLIVAA